MKIGLVVAIEMSAIKKYYVDLKEEKSPKGFEVFTTKSKGHDIVIIHCGMGEIAAASGVQYLCDKYNVDIIANFGVVGGLTSDMQKYKICIVEKVVHYKYDCSEFMDLVIGQVDGHDSIYLSASSDLIEKAVKSNNIPKVICCSGDKFISTKEEKEYLHNKFGGDICEMEAAGIVLTSEINDVPCMLIKAVSDGLVGGAREFYDEYVDAAYKCLEVLDEVIGEIEHE